MEPATPSFFATLVSPLAPASLSVDLGISSATALATALFESARAAAPFFAEELGPRSA